MDASGKPLIAVIGAGPAGLAAAARLGRTLGDRAHIQLIHMGHHLGGKAASWEGTDGAPDEHGFHICFGFYRAMFALMDWAGIDRADVLQSGQHRFTFIDDATRELRSFERAANPLRFLSNLHSARLMPFVDELNFGRFLGLVSWLVGSGADLRVYDDRCFTAFALEHGLKERATYNSVFRFYRQGYFNWPSEISAYHTLQTHRALASRDDSEMFNFRRPMSEAIWKPIAQRVERLGVERVPFKKWTGLRLAQGGGRDWVGGITLTEPEASEHELTARWPDYVHEDHRTDVEIAPDYVVSAIPVEDFKWLRVGDGHLKEQWGFRNVAELNSGSTIALTIETRHPIADFRIPTTSGLRGPLDVITDMKPISAGYRDREEIGSALSLVGQPGEYEGWSDEEILRATLHEIEQIPGVRPSAEWDITRTALHRNLASHERLFLGEPGVQKFRPAAATRLSNLVLAGDWVQNELDIVCMEAAIRSGEKAADLVLEKLEARS